MNARDELAQLIATTLDRIFGNREAEPAQQDYKLTDELLAAGYSKPRTITTAEELDALGRGASVLDAGQNVWTNDGDSLDQWGCVHHDDYPVSLVWRGSADVALPATVLFEGVAA